MCDFVNKTSEFDTGGTSVQTLTLEVSVSLHLVRVIKVCDQDNSACSYFSLNYTLYEKN